MHSIEVSDLRKNFGPLAAVDGVSFEVEEGEVFGFLGPNGAGKTTTINILCTLLSPTSGHATVAGYDVKTQRNAVRQSIGLVFQDPSLDDQLTAMENLRFHSYVYNVPGDERAGRIEEVLRVVELWERRDAIVRTFSGGMKRRLEIARGLIHRPRVLFLDEPTIGLDPQTREHIWSYILQLQRAHRITIFMTTHYMEEAEHCQRIGIIDRGRLVALDTPDALKRMVGADIVTLRTTDNERAMVEIEERYGLKAQSQDGRLRLEVPNGAEFIPKVVSELGVPVESVDLHRPTLDDVFMRLTGHVIREDEADPLAFMRMHGRLWRGGGRR
ncbi:MAG: ATP-binding cassette domain-containing protein [Acidobacteria bacterium]|nr:ATP-binding cassette domain-containing protein [Acidobacteriota bacterium]